MNNRLLILMRLNLKLTIKKSFKLLLSIVILISFVFSIQAAEMVSIDTSDHWRQTHLTQAERNWLNKHSTIRHGTRSGSINKPFEYTDYNDIYKGLTADYMQIFSDKLGIDIRSEYRTDDKKNLVIALKNKDIELVTYLHQSTKGLANISFSKPIIKMPLILLGRKNKPILQSINNLTTERIIVQEKTYAHQILKKNHRNLKVSFIDSVPAGLEAISSGQADIFIQNAFSIEYHQRKLGINNIKILATTPYNYNIHFAVPSSMSPLLTIFEKVIKDTSALEKRLIFDKWINIEVERKLDLKLLLIIVLVVVATIFMIVLFFTHWNRRLTLEVNNRTAELRDLARHMDNLKEEEKAKLAREIHDELGHTLTSLIVGIKRLRALTTDDKCIEKTKELNDLVLQASKTSKQIMTDLRPSILEDLGLVAAIDWLANDFKIKHGVSCKVNARDLPVKLKDEAAIALFRIVQESLTNIAKHACAGQVEIIIVIENKILKLSISDDGQGLKSGWKTKQGSYGLKGISERAIALGGKMKLTSESKNGVHLLIKIPINDRTIREDHFDK